MLTIAEQLTKQFYDWERRGRGWQVWDYPVEFEPAFYPFMFCYPSLGPIRDDARKPTFIGSLVEKLRSSQSTSSAQAEEGWSELLAEAATLQPEPAVSYTADDLVEIQLALPPQLKVNKETTLQFLYSLRYCSFPLSFEVIGLEHAITIQLVCHNRDYPQVRHQLEAYFPEAVLTAERAFLQGCWEEAEGGDTLVVDFGLSAEFMRPLQCSSNFEVDPLIGITGAVADLRNGEVGLLQVLFQSASEPWSESIMRSVTDLDGKAFFNDAPETVALAKHKVSCPLFASVIRVATKGGQSDRCWQIARNLGGALARFASPGSNELIPLSNDGYSDRDHEWCVLNRQSFRTGMLLNSDELVSLVHPPSASVRSIKLKREEKRTKAAPTLAAGHSLVLGENSSSGKISLVTLSADQRMRHIYIIGASGTGKSTLLLNLIVQDINNGEGLAVLDPHGDLIDQILEYIPEARFGDVVLLDPSDEEYPVGFNILSAHSELEKNLLASDLVAVFRRLSTSWGDQMTSILGNAILAFLESDTGGSLLDLRRFLVEADFRQRFLSTVRDPEIVYFWQKEYPLLSGNRQGPILTRLDTFLRPKLIRHMVSQKENRLDFGSIMNEGKIFLAKLSQGAIGEENAYLLGTLLVSKLHQLAMSRQEMKEEKRRSFFLYIDEFQNFVTPSMASILSSVRKYRLGLTLAHQELRQLLSRDDDVTSAVLSNPYTRICFRLGDFDAKKLEDGFSFFEARDLQNLGIGEAICRVERAEYDFNLKTLPRPEGESVEAEQRRERIIQLSREKYATKRETVEVEMRRGAVVSVSPSTPIPEPVIEKTEEPIVERVSPARVETRAEVKEKVKTVPKAPVTLGRGGQQHKYLQHLIKKIAEDKGYRAVIEKQVLGGLGSVDVALERDGATIAIEISVTSTADQEVANIEKCLQAGFDKVVLVCSERKFLTKAEGLIAARLQPEDLARIQFICPEEIFAFFEGLAAQGASHEGTVRGYKVKVGYKAVSEGEKTARKQAISRTILDALKRMKGPEK